MPSSCRRIRPPFSAQLARPSSGHCNPRHKRFDVPRAGNVLVPSHISVPADVKSILKAVGFARTGVFVMLSQQYRPRERRPYLKEEPVHGGRSSVSAGLFAVVHELAWSLNEHITEVMLPCFLQQLLWSGRVTMSPSRESLCRHPRSAHRSALLYVEPTPDR